VSPEVKKNVQKIVALVNIKVFMDLSFHFKTNCLLTYLFINTHKAAKHTHTKTLNIKPRGPAETEPLRLDPRTGGLSVAEVHLLAFDHLTFGSHWRW